jgi:hypothetical protein
MWLMKAKKACDAGSKNPFGQVNVESGLEIPPGALNPHGGCSKFKNPLLHYYMKHVRGFPSGQRGRIVGSRNP